MLVAFVSMLTHSCSIVATLASATACTVFRIRRIADIAAFAIRRASLGPVARSAGTPARDVSF